MDRIPQPHTTQKPNRTRRSTLHTQAAGGHQAKAAACCPSSSSPPTAARSRPNKGSTPRHHGIHHHHYHHCLPGGGPPHPPHRHRHRHLARAPIQRGAGRVRGGSGLHPGVPPHRRATDGAADAGARHYRAGLPAADRCVFFSCCASGSLLLARSIDWGAGIDKDVESNGWRARTHTCTVDAEGARGLYKGLSAPLAAQAVYKA